MNYIKEINAFYDQVERNPLSASAVTLWHTLMHINNKAMWIDKFTVAAPVLRLKSGLKESSFKRARAELKEKGYIDFQSRPNNQAPIYQMISLVVDMGDGGTTNIDECVNDGDQGRMSGGSSREGNGGHVGSRGSGDRDDQVSEHAGNRPSHVPADQTIDQVNNQSTYESSNIAKGQLADHLTNDQVNQIVDQDAGPLYKHKLEKIKRNQSTTTASDAFVFYQENFGIISPFVADSLLHWVNDIGEFLVLEAMKRALERNKLSFGYVKSILQAWQKKGIKTVEQAKAEEVAYRNERARNGAGKRNDGYVTTAAKSNSRAKSKEIIPDWFEKHQQEARAKSAEKEASSQTNQPTLATIQARIDALRDTGTGSLSQGRK